MTDTFLDFAAGAVSMGFAVCGLYFLRFWRATRDGLFLAFALAFWLLGISQATITFAAGLVEERSWLFLLRLAAFLLILLAILRKNRRSSG
jgi:hypothetical protein